MISKDDFSKIIPLTDIVVERADEWLQLIEFESADSPAARRSKNRLIKAFDPLWMEVNCWRSGERDESEWEDFQRLNPRLAPAAANYSVALKQAMYAFFPNRVEKTSDQEKDAEKTKFEVVTERRKNLDLLKKSLKSLRTAFNEGPEEVWLTPSDIHNITKKMTKPVVLSQIKIQGEKGEFKIRQIEPGASHRYEIEVGSFFRWYLKKNRSELGLTQC